MQISQIEQALVIAAEGSISRAAQKLYLSQPNLSQSLKQLETELGKPLFERNGRGVTLTPFGREFLAFAQPAYRHFQMLGEFCSASEAVLPLTFSVASQYLRFANTVFTDFCRTNCDIPYQFSFIEGSFHEVVELVQSYEAELGLLIMSPPQRKMMLPFFQRNNLEYRALAEEEDMAIIVRSGHPLCTGGRTTVTTAELLQYPLANYRDVHYSLLPGLNPMGLSQIKQRITVKDRATLYELLSKTDAFTLGVHNRMAYQNTEYYADKCALRLTDNRMLLEIGFIVNRSRPLSPIAEAYLRELQRITHSPKTSAE
ncbi:MAG: LysR family transcriptional regulator [Candidatus Avoscillospira sp.]